MTNLYYLRDIEAYSMTSGQHLFSMSENSKIGVTKLFLAILGHKSSQIAKKRHFDQFFEEVNMLEK